MTPKLFLLFFFLYCYEMKQGNNEINIEKLSSKILKLMNLKGALKSVMLKNLYPCTLKNQFTRREAILN